MSRLVAPLRPVVRILVVVACALLVLASPEVFAQQGGRKPVIVLDPGHGGSQDGAVSPSGMKEKVLALQLARRVRTALQQELGATVILTREHDTDLLLADRVALANARAPDLFISIHANSMPPVRARSQVRGVEIYFLSASASGVDAARIAARENAEGPAQASKRDGDILAFILADLQRQEAHGDSSRLAYALQKALVEATGATDRGVHQAPFYVLNGLLSPAVLVEVGYLSHPEESVRLADKAYQQDIAGGIVEGVRQFLGFPRRQAEGDGPAVTASGAE